MKYKLKKHKNILSKIYYKIITSITVMLITTPVLADIPSAPSGAGNSNDPLKMGMNVFKEGASYTNIVLYIVIIFGYIGGLFASFLHAKKHKEWGQFSAVAIVGLAVVVVAIILLNQSKTAISG